MKIHLSFLWKMFGYKIVEFECSSFIKNKIVKGVNTTKMINCICEIIFLINKILPVLKPYDRKWMKNRETFVSFSLHLLMPMTSFQKPTYFPILIFCYLLFYVSLCFLLCFHWFNSYFVVTFSFSRKSVKISEHYLKNFENFSPKVAVLKRQRIIVAAFCLHFPSDIA